MAANNDNRMPAWPGWETVRLIGRGSFGAVYEIERDVFGEVEKAALKAITIPQNDSEIDELYSEGYDDESVTNTYKAYLKSIAAEYSLMRKMNGSANVVNCDDVRYVQQDNGIGWDIFIKMELLTPLVKALGKEATDEQVIRIGADICKALILCKKHNIIHRDIKPANIFVSENGDYKLGDFGIAKTVEKTSGGTKIGTYEYMAPEVYHDRPYGSTVDIYSLGMVLYWLLNERRMPFLNLPPDLPTNSEKEEARKRRLSGEAIPAPAHGSEELKRIVLKACAYDPKDRYRSAEEMLRDLEALSGKAAAPTPEQPVTRPVAQEPEENGTVSAFDTTAERSARPAPQPETQPEEDATASASKRPTPLAPHPETEDEDKTVGAFDREKERPALQSKPAPKPKCRLWPILVTLAAAAVLILALMQTGVIPLPGQAAASSASPAATPTGVPTAYPHADLTMGTGDTTFSGDKNITVIVVHKDESKKEIKINTSAETLRAACEEQNLIAGDESEYGLYVKTVDGETADDGAQEWWCFTKDGEMSMTGVDDTMIADGEQYEFTFTVGW